MNAVLRHPDLRALLLLLAVCAGFLAPALSGARVLLPADVLYTWKPWAALAPPGFVAHNDLIADQVLQDYGWRTLLQQSLRSGELPLWIPNIFTGAPFLASGQPAVLYPPALLLFGLLPIETAYGWFAFAHLFIAGAGAFLLLRALGAARPAAWLSGVVLALSGVMSVSLQWPQVTGVFCWFPWLVLCVHRMTGPQGGRWPPAGWWLGAAGVTGLLLLGGQAELGLYALVLSGGYGLMRTTLLAGAAGWSVVLGRALTAAGSVVVGTGLAAAQLVPEAAVLSENFRAAGVTYDQVAGWALPKLHFIAFWVPDFFGNPTHHQYFDLIQGVWRAVEGSRDLAGEPRTYPFWGARNYVEGTAYLGVLPLALALVAPLVRRDASTRFFTAFALVALLLAFGTPLYAVWLQVPFVNQLQTPFRWLYPFVFCGAVLAGLAFDRLLSGQDRRLERRLRLVLAAGSAGLLALLALGWLALPHTLSLLDTLRRRSASLGAAFPTPEMLLSYEARPLAWCALLLGLGATALALGRRRSGLLAPAAIAIVVADLAGFGWGFVAFSDPAPLRLDPPALAWLRVQDGPFRVAALGSAGQLPPNTAVAAGIEDIRGYESIIPARYAEFWKLLAPPVDLIYNRLNHLRDAAAADPRVLGMINVKYLFSDLPLTRPGWKPVYDADLTIYENAAVVPRAYAVFAAVAVDGDAAARRVLADAGFDPRTTVVVEGQAAAPGPGGAMVPARVTARSANTVTVGVDMPRPGYLVLLEAHAPGWQAEDATGRALPVVRANALFRGVPLPEGSHSVRFRYLPDSLRYGAFVALLSAAVWLLAGGASLARRFQAGSETSQAGRVARNTLTPMAAQLLGRTIDFGFAIVMLRLLGPTSYGGYSFAVSLVGYFAVVTDFGLGVWLTREAARDPDQARAQTGRVMAVRLLLCCAVAPAFLAATGGFHLTGGLAAEASVAALLFLVSLFPSSIAATLSAAFSARERMDLPAAIGVAMSVGRAAIGLVVLFGGGGVVGLGAVSVAVSTGNALVFWWLARRLLFPPGLFWDGSAARRLIAGSLPLMLNNLLNNVFFRADILVLQALRGAAAVGYYATAYRFIDGLLIIPSVLTLALFPAFSRFAAGDRLRLLQEYRRAVRLLVIVALPLTLGLAYFAGPLITLLFGTAFLPAVRPLQILALFLPLSFINGVTQYVLIALNRQRHVTGAFALAAAFNVGANLLLVGTFGMEGAAAVTVLSEVVLMAPFLAGVRRELGGTPFEARLLRAVAALAVPLAAGLLLPGDHPGWVAAAGGLGYAAAVLALGALDSEDRRLLLRMVGR